MRGPRETSCEYIFELCTERIVLVGCNGRTSVIRVRVSIYLYLQRPAVRTFCEIRWYHGTWLPSYKKDVARFFDAQISKLKSCSCLHEKAIEFGNRQT